MDLSGCNRIGRRVCLVMGLLCALLMSASASAAPCKEDLFPVGNPDFIVGPGDLAQLLSKWGPCAAPCPADLFPVGAGDGVVGPGDLGQLLASWGQCK